MSAIYIKTKCIHRVLLYLSRYLLKHYSTETKDIVISGNKSSVICLDWNYGLLSNKISYLDIVMSGNKSGVICLDWNCGLLSNEISHLENFLVLISHVDELWREYNNRPCIVIWCHVSHHYEHIVFFSFNLYPRIEI